MRNPILLAGAALLTLSGPAFAQSHPQSQPVRSNAKANVHVAVKPQAKAPRPAPVRQTPVRHPGVSTTVHAQTRPAPKPVTHAKPATQAHVQPHVAAKPAAQQQQQQQQARREADQRRAGAEQARQREAAQHRQQSGNQRQTQQQTQARIDRNRRDAVQDYRAREQQQQQQQQNRQQAVNQARRQNQRRIENRRYVVERANYIRGCPPGLIKRNNGCQAPVQARAIRNQRQRYANWYGYRRWNAQDRYDWRYSDGYLYGTQPSSNVVTVFLPLIGGALSGGNPWPATYTDYDIDPYYSDYYGSGDSDYEYRYADGAVYAVDPNGDQDIHGIAGLLTDDEWTVGQPMPAGYDFYNVPYDYRSRYADGPDSIYRYSDGYVYQVDPTTQVVRAVLQLIA